MAFDGKHLVNPVQNNGERARFAHVLDAFHESVGPYQCSAATVSVGERLPSLLAVSMLKCNKHIINWKDLIFGSLCLFSILSSNEPS
jgi:hypothetical protein